MSSSSSFGISKESVRNSRNEMQRNATQRGKVGGIVGRGKLKRAPRLRFEARGEVEKLSSAIIHREREEREREAVAREIGSAPRLFAKSSVKRGVIVNARGFGKGGGRRD